MKHLTIEDIKIKKPDFEAIKTPKGQIIADWLIEWVKYSIECGIADFGDFIPSKEDLASFLEVSPATIQNSIRQVKNLGYFSSKQSLGTYINDFYSKEPEFIDELYQGSLAQCKIKKVIIDKKIKPQEPIPEIKELSKLCDTSQNTIRFSLLDFVRQGYLEQVKIKGNKYRWILKKEFVLSKVELSNGIQDENFTLTHQLVKKIQSYIEKTYKQGEKILPNLAFAAMFNVSIKTINDAMKILNNKKIIQSRRGKYGTIYLGKEKSKNEFTSSERKKLQDKNFCYCWQKALEHLKKHIAKNYEIGDKIAPIRELANVLNVSPNTIRRALRDLIKNNYLFSQRGKTGGIFINEMPETLEDTYRWLALNPKVINADN